MPAQTGGKLSSREKKKRTEKKTSNHHSEISVSRKGEKGEEKNLRGFLLKSRKKGNSNQK